MVSLSGGVTLYRFGPPDIVGILFPAMPLRKRADGVGVLPPLGLEKPYPRQLGAGDKLEMARLVSDGRGMATSSSGYEEIEPLVLPGPVQVGIFYR